MDVVQNLLFLNMLKEGYSKDRHSFDEEQYLAVVVNKTVKNKNSLRNHRALYHKNVTTENIVRNELHIWVESESADVISDGSM